MKSNLKRVVLTCSMLLFVCAGLLFARTAAAADYAAEGIDILCDGVKVTSGSTVAERQYRYVSDYLDFTFERGGTPVSVSNCRFTSEFRGPADENYGSPNASSSGRIYIGNVGTYRITLDFSYWGAYCGGTSLSGQAVFYAVVNPRDLNSTDIKFSEIASSYTYTGNYVRPSVSVRHEDGTSSRTLYQNSDYKISYSNTLFPGKAKMTFTGTGNYTGKKVLSYSIKAPLTAAKITGVKKTYTYTGKAITPAVTVKLTSASGTTRTAKLDTNYTVTYSKNTEAGEGTVTIKGKGYYTGTYKIRFGIVPKSVTGVKASSPEEYSAKLTWKPSAGADGYIIERKDPATGAYQKVARLANQKWGAFEDLNSGFKESKTYTYRITPFVRGGVKSTDTSVHYLTEDTDYLISYTKVTTSDGYTYYQSSYKYYSMYYGSSVTVKCKVTSSVTESYTPIYTGCADIDYQAEQICKKIIKKDMTVQEKVKAIYNYVVNKTEHDKDYANHKRVYNYNTNASAAKEYEEKALKKIYAGTASCNFDGWGYIVKNNGNFYTLSCQDKYHTENYRATLYGSWDRTVEAFSQHAGGCSYQTRMFLVLCNHIGVRGGLVTGCYINRNGETPYHEWAYLRVGKKYAWYDPAIASNSSSYASNWYKRTGASYWGTCHAWLLSRVPDSLNADYKMVKSKYSQKHIVSDYSKKYDGYVDSYGDYIGTSLDKVCIPGLSKSDDMTPQGITYVEDLDMFLITAYDRKAKKPSVIYALDRKSGYKVGEFYLYNSNGSKNTSHLGGIAASDSRVYFTCGGSKIGYVSLGWFFNLTGSAQDLTIEGTVNLSKYLDGAPTSYLCYSDGCLWTGNFYHTVKKYKVPADEKYNSLVLGFNLADAPYYQEEAVLRDGPDYTLKIPNSISKIQSAAVHDGKLYLNCSYGRTSKSTLYIGAVKLSSSVVVKKANMGSLTMLPMGEGFCFGGNYMYYIQESGAYCYRNGDGNGNSKHPSDVVWRAKVSTLVSKAGK